MVRLQRGPSTPVSLERGTSARQVRRGTNIFWVPHGNIFWVPHGTVLRWCFRSSSNQPSTGMRNASRSFFRHSHHAFSGSPILNLAMISMDHSVARHAASTLAVCSPTRGRQPRSVHLRQRIVVSMRSHPVLSRAYSPWVVSCGSQHAENAECAGSRTLYGGGTTFRTRITSNVSQKPRLGANARSQLARLLLWSACLPPEGRTCRGYPRRRLCDA